MALAVFVVLLAAATLQMVYYYPRLPEPMASHFDLQGRADGWSPKGSFFGIMAGMLYGVSGLLVLVGLSMRWLPAFLVNLPHKDIWLAPPESRRTRAFLVNWMLWFANATIVLMMGMNHATSAPTSPRGPAEIRRFSSGWGCTSRSRSPGASGSGGDSGGRLFDRIYRIAGLTGWTR